jgi:hypothetical protein
VVGYSFDETRQNFPGVRLRTIAFQDSPKFVSDFRLEAAER